MEPTRPKGKLTFAQWRQRPVYLTQCRTWRKAAELNLCSLGIRALPGHRDIYAQAARDMIALSFRMDRMSQRLAAKNSKEPTTCHKS